MQSYNYLRSPETTLRFYAHADKSSKNLIAEKLNAKDKEKSGVSDIDAEETAEKRSEKSPKKKRRVAVRKPRANITPLPNLQAV